MSRPAASSPAFISRYDQCAGASVFCGSGHMTGSELCHPGIAESGATRS